jgi:basic amino acid/polyamine antiporter, APA family
MLFVSFDYAAEYPAFLIGWLSLILYQFGALVAVIHWSQYVVHFFELVASFNATRSMVEPPIGWSNGTVGFYITGDVLNLPAIAITIAITALLLIGIRETAMVNLVLVVFKMIVILVFIITGAVYVDRNNYTPFIPTNLGNAIERADLLNHCHSSPARFIWSVRCYRRTAGLVLRLLCLHRF